MSVGTACILEPRAHPALTLVIRQVAKFLPPSWNILVIHGTTNIAAVTEATKHLGNRVTLRQGGFMNLTQQQYNVRLLTVSFWESMPTENILIFQTDSLLLGPGLERFLGYDYVGAPWRWRKRTKGGNGGLSLRKKSSMIEALKRHLPKKIIGNEDLFFSRAVRSAAPYHVGKRFGVESVWHKWPVSVHKPWRHLSTTKLLMLKRKFPSVASLHRLNVPPRKKPNFKSIITRKKRRANAQKITRKTNKKKRARTKTM